MTEETKTPLEGGGVMSSVAANWYSIGRPIRCIEGRLLRHDPQWDDPDLETDVGPCPDCCGYGCDDEGLARLAAHEDEAAR